MAFSAVLRSDVCYSLIVSLKSKQNKALDLICVKVNNKEKTSPEWMHKVSHKMETDDKSQKQTSKEPVR